VAAEGTGLADLAGRYATALFDLADEQKSLDAIADDLRSLRAMLDGSGDLQRLVRSPVLSREAQGEAMAALADKADLQTLSRNFLGLLARNRRLFLLRPVIDAFLQTLAARRGEVSAEVTSAQPLSDSQLAAVTAALEKSVAGSVSVEAKVDPALLGGMVVRVGSRMVDSSLRSKLQRLEMAMKGAG
jgi:F-type H+-transporting ATPase subunit delta